MVSSSSPESNTSSTSTFEGVGMSNSSSGININTLEQGSDSSSDTIHHSNLIISTPNVPETKLEVENETQLLKYLDSFDNKMDTRTIPIRFSSYYMKNDEIDDDTTQNHFREYESNSPVSMSLSGSDEENEHKNYSSSHSYFKRLTYAEVEKSIEKYYSPNQKYSNEFDILVTYLKGQKNLYIQAKNITQTKLNILVFPSIILTAFITVFAPTIDMTGTTVYIISAINAVIAILVGLSNYLKLESKTETYAQIANQYDKLETTIELSSNKLFFMTKETEQNELILNKIKYIENKLNDIKESNTVLIPEEVKKIFPVIYHINIFSFIKKIETYKKKLIMQFKDIKNEIGYIIHKWNQREINIFEEDVKHIPLSLKTQFMKEQNRLMYLMNTKEKIKNDLICYKTSYGQIDELFIREIKNAESFAAWIFGSYRKPIIYEPNPVIQEFLKIIFIEP